MSSTFTLHTVPFAVPGDPRALERAELVRDGFSWGACLVPALWLFWHRHWLAGIAALVVVAGLGGGLWGLGARPGTIVLAEALLHILLGLEGASLRRLSLARVGRPAVDVVIASDSAEAEAKSFARWLATGADSHPRAAPADAPMSRARFEARAPQVIGLFPDAEGRP